MESKLPPLTPNSPFPPSRAVLHSPLTDWLRLKLFSTTSSMLYKHLFLSYVRSTRCALHTQPVAFAGVTRKLKQPGRQAGRQLFIHHSFLFISAMGPLFSLSLCVCVCVCGFSISGYGNAHEYVFASQKYEREE